MQSVQFKRPVDPVPGTGGQLLLVKFAETLFKNGVRWKLYPKWKGRRDVGNVYAQEEKI